MPGLKKLSSLSLDPEDAITLRARVIQFKYSMDKDNVEMKMALLNISSAAVERISVFNASYAEYLEVLWELADLFASPHISVSSFELLKSVVVDGLLQFVTDENRTARIQRRKEILLDAFACRKMKGYIRANTPFTTLVKKLQESLTRMESSFDVITITQNSSDSKRSPPSLLACLLRLSLVTGDDSDSST